MELGDSRHDAHSVLVGFAVDVEGVIQDHLVHLLALDVRASEGVCVARVEDVKLRATGGDGAFGGPDRPERVSELRLCAAKSVKIG